MPAQQEGSSVDELKSICAEAQLVPKSGKGGYSIIHVKYSFVMLPIITLKYTH